MKSIISSDHLYQYPTINADPTLADLPVGTQQTFRNTSTGDLEHWGNNNGVIEKIGGDPLLWGGITGTLSDQTDLQAELDAKQNIDEQVTVEMVDAIADQYIWQLDNSADVTLSSTNLTRWNEKGGSGKDFVIASGYPTYYTTGSNGKPYVTGSNLTLSTFPVSTTPVTMYFLIRTPTLIDDTILVYWGNINGPNGPRYAVSTFGSDLYIYTGDPPYYSARYTNIKRTDWMLFTITFKDANSIKIEVNDEPMGFHLDTAGSTAYAFEFLNLSSYSGLQVSEFRIFSRVTTADEDADIKKYFIDKYNLQKDKNNSVIIFGDSHSNGIGATTSYPKLLHTTSGLDFINISINGYTVESTVQGNVVLSYYSIYNKTKWKNYWVLFNLGTNDAATANAGYAWHDWLRWKDDYKEYIVSFIENGFDRNKIIIATPPYSTNSYVQGQLSTVRDKILEIADELKIQLADWYGMMVAAGFDANTISGGDGIHVDDASHALIASRIDYIIKRISNQFFESTANPTVYVLGNKEQGVFKNTTSGYSKVWINDGGTIKSLGPLSGSFSQAITATTTVTVTIGLTQPSASYYIQLTPTSAIAIGYRVTNKTTTTFDVVIPVATGTLTFDWTLTF